MRRSGCCYSCFSFGDVEKRRIYWFDSSYVVDEILQDGIDVRILLIACVAQKLVDGTGKALSFCWKRQKSHRLKNEERKRERKKKKSIIVCRINGVWLCAFFEHKRNNCATNLSK